MLIKYKSSFAILFILLLSLVVPAIAQDPGSEEELEYEMDPIVVTGSRIPSQLSELGQSIVVFSAEQIKEIPVNSLDEALKYISGIDVRQRGPGSVQSDVSVRGSTFEQTLMLIDGMAMNDPQTGHHNMNLPLNLDDVARIEIVKGTASRLYGPNAMGGVINIITKRKERFKVNAYAKYGDYNLIDYGASVPFQLAGTFHKFSLSHRASDGYIGNDLNDFNVITGRYSFDWEPLDDWQFKLGGGYTDRDFGAYKYYFEDPAEQRENTQTILGYQNINWDADDFYLHQKSYVRLGEDVFSYPDTSAGRIENRSETAVYGGQIDIGLIWRRIGKTNIGFDYSSEEITSNSLGNNERYRTGFTFEHRVKLYRKLNIGVGFTSIDYDEYGSDTWPGFDFSWTVFENFEVHGSADKGYRMPSFTELYYSDPGNEGNPDLDPEEIYHFEVGARTRNKGLVANASVFYKDGRNILDWVRQEDGRYYIQNFTDVQFFGAEAGLELYPNLDLWILEWPSAFINYTYLESDLDSRGQASKYVLNNLTHQINAGISVKYLRIIYNHISAKLNQRVEDDPYLVLDTRIGTQLWGVDAYAEVTNILDQEYYEAGFAPMPGRWISVGVNLTIDFAE